MLLLLLLPAKPVLTRVKYNKTEVDAALRGNMHLVFVSDPGPSMYMSHVPDAGRLTYEKAAQLAERVNSENETGTLWPDYSVSIVPLTVFRNRDDSGNMDIMRQHLEDVFIANEEYIKLSHIFFCFERRPDFDYDTADALINELCSKEYQYARRISVL